MRSTVGAVMGLLVVTSTPAASQPCASIRDADTRHLCNAIERQDASRCNTIRHPDGRAACMAEVGHDSDRCSTIRDDDQRALCKARAGRGGG